MSVKKFFAILLVLALMITLVAGCQTQTQTSSPTESQTEASSSDATTAPEASAANTSGEMEKLTIGFLLPTLQFPFYVRMYEGFEAACQSRGWDFIFVDGNLDAQKQVNGALDLVAKGVDALVYSTWWPDAMREVHEECVKVGIPVFMMDQTTVLENTTYVTTTGTNNYDAGFIGGVWTASYLKKNTTKTSLNLVNITKASETAVDRCKGFMDGLVKGGITVNLKNEYIADTREKAMSVTEDALVTYDDIDFIFGYSAQSSLGAYDASQAAGKDQILIMGFDGEDDEIVLIDKGGQYIGTVIQFPAEMSQFIVQCVEDTVIHKKTLDPIIPFGAGVYSKDGIIKADEIG